MLGIMAKGDWSAVAFPTALIVYFGFVIQTLNSEKFHEEFNHKQKIRKIQDLNFECRRLGKEAKSQANAVYAEKLKRVIQDKDEIVDSFFRGERSYLRERIVEQTLTLVVSYIKLLTNYCIRNRGIAKVNVGDITGRINMNTRKMGFAKDIRTLDELQRVIDMDTKIIERLKEEQRELERINAKLDYMQSTVNMFKHQIISSIESEEMLEQLDTAVNEASALDSVLNERKKNRMRI
jgi:phage host-nuclease inhibitor protein Gam